MGKKQKIQVLGIATKKAFSRYLTKVEMGYNPEDYMAGGLMKYLTEII